MNMVNTTYISTQDMINKIQLLKHKTKPKFYENVSNFNDEMNYRNLRDEEDPLSKTAHVITEICIEVLLFLKFLQTKPQVKIMNCNYYHLYDPLIKNRGKKEIVKNQYEDNEIDYVNFNDNILNPYIGRKTNNEKLR